MDATILHAPTSTKNREQQRDPEMHQTKKGNQWFFGMKAHVGVDSKTKIIHTAVATPAHVADSRVLRDLLHGEETRVWGDQAYRGQTEVIQECAPRAQDHTHRRYRYKNGIDEEERAKNRTKSSVRSKVEHVFQVMKLKFGFVKLRYRGLKKNAHQLFVICGLVNLFLKGERSGRRGRSGNSSAAMSGGTVARSCLIAWIDFPMPQKTHTPSRATAATSIGRNDCRRSNSAGGQ